MPAIMHNLNVVWHVLAAVLATAALVHVLSALREMAIGTAGETD